MNNSILVKVHQERKRDASGFVSTRKTLEYYKSTVHRPPLGGLRSEQTETTHRVNRREDDKKKPYPPNPGKPVGPVCVGTTR